MMLKRFLDRMTPWRELQGAGPQANLWRAALLIIVINAMLGVFADIRNTAKFGQIDMRNRVVGARVLLQEGNPYTYLWHPGEPTTLLDPYPFSENRLMSAVTVTPAVLSVHAAFADVPYRYQKFLWFSVQFMLFGGMVWLAMARVKNAETRAAVLLFGLMLSCSTFWHMHVERGQAYVLFAFFAVLYIASLSWRTANRGALGGFILGLLVCLRPQMVLLGFPLLVYRKWSAVLGAVVGVGVGFLIPTLIAKSVWPSYVQAMANYAQPASAPSNTEARKIAPPKIELPLEIEGIPRLGSFAFFGDMDTSLKKAVSFYLHIRLPASLYFGLVAAGMAAWFFYTFQLMRTGVPLDFCTAKTLGLVLFIEIILPITRAEYSNMIFVPIILMIFAIREKSSAIRTWEWALLISAWLLTAPFPPWMSAGFRGPALVMFSQCAIMLWAACVPWRPSTPAVPVAREAVPNGLAAGL